MPLYEYKCKKCGRVFEVLQKLSDPTLSIHKNCGGELERLVSPAAFQFKGSGWYVNDYAKSGSRPKSQEASAAKEAKSDAAKPAADAKPKPSTSTA